MAIDLFLEQIKSPKTKEVYANLLKAFTAKTGTRTGLRVVRIFAARVQVKMSS